jgi:dipeptidyl aminopeptidase/acylaminoacyl peptidase
VKKAIDEGDVEKAQDIAMAAYDEEVYVINADGSGRTNLTKNSAADVAPTWSPDGKKITFMSDRDGDFDIYTMDADGSDVAQVTNLPGDDDSPDWQPLPRTVHQPDTGGLSLMMVASALLFSGGVMFYAGLKRRM